MELVTPDIGLFFWMLVSFTIVLVILKKFAWKPILNGLKAREESINQALNSAKKAKEEMAKLQKDNEQIIKEAKLERDQLITEAREIKEKIISEAKLQAGQEAKKVLDLAKQNIEGEKAAMLNDLKKQVIEISVDIAEKILQKELEKKQEQNDFIEKIVKDIHLN